MQESRIVRVIRKQLVRRSLDMIEELASKEGGEDYKTFWEAFGRNLKVGVFEGFKGWWRCWPQPLPPQIS